MRRCHWCLAAVATTVVVVVVVVSLVMAMLMSADSAERNGENAAPDFRVMTFRDVPEDTLT